MGLVNKSGVQGNLLDDFLNTERKFPKKILILKNIFYYIVINMNKNFPKKVLKKYFSENKEKSS